MKQVANLNGGFLYHIPWPSCYNCTDVVRSIYQGVLYSQNVARFQNVAECAAFRALILAELTTTESVPLFLHVSLKACVPCRMKICKIRAVLHLCL
jgi:trehalose-6-phosphate synthase